MLFKFNSILKTRRVTDDFSQALRELNGDRKDAMRFYDMEGDIAHKSTTEQVWSAQVAQNMTDEFYRQIQKVHWSHG